MCVVKEEFAVAFMIIQVASRSYKIDKSASISPKSNSLDKAGKFEDLKDMKYHMKKDLYSRNLQDDSQTSWCLYSSEKQQDTYR